MAWNNGIMLGDNRQMEGYYPQRIVHHQPDLILLASWAGLRVTMISLSLSGLLMLDITNAMGKVVIRNLLFLPLIIK